MGRLQLDTTPHQTALHVPVIRGREGGDYDLSRLLRWTRWGAGGGSNSLAQGCSVRDMVAAMEDPLQRGSCFRNVSSDSSVFRFRNARSFLNRHSVCNC